MNKIQTESSRILTGNQRKYLADKLAATAHIVLGGLAIGQFLGEGPFRFWLFALGVGIYTMILVVGLLLMRGEENRMDPREVNLLILMVGVLIVALVLAGPTLYHDYKKRRQRKS